MTTRPDEPALGYPAGEMRQDEAGGAAFFTGIVPFTDLRVPSEKGVGGGSGRGRDSA